MEASGLEEDTPHAPFPTERTDQAWIDFANRESGQLDKSNIDKRAVVGIGKACDAWLAEAKDAVNRKKFLGVF